MKNWQKWLIGLLVVGALSVGSYWGYTQVFAQAETATEEEEIQTTKVRRGDIIITTGGEATLLPAAEIEIGFEAGGTLIELNVQEGDRVDMGDIIARLDDVELQLQLAEAELNVAIAEADLEVAKSDSQETLDDAWGYLADVQADLDIYTNDSMTQTLLDLRLAEQDLAAANETLANAMDPARDWERNIEAVRDNAEAVYETALVDYEVTLANYNISVADLQSTVDGAWESVTDAQEALEGGLGTTIESAEWALEQARVDLEQIQLSLDQMTLSAPITGTVVTVNADVGETVGTDPLVTIIDMDEPLLLFYLEESDLDKTDPGNLVEVRFNAWPDDVFEGEIVRVEPALTEIDGTPALQVWASVDVPDRETYPLFSGMSAEVEVIAGESLNTLLVPVQALRELAPGEYFVFIVGENDELELRVVEVGLMDFANAEILSGLELGDMVSTGIVETE